MQLGLIGCGGIGAIRAEAMSQAATVNLAALSDLDQPRAQALANQFGGDVVADWRDMLNRPDIDAVVVSTPPSIHTEMCVAALQAGKHVLCEKPLARNPDECRQILAAAAESGKQIATGFNYRFYPSIKKAREIFDSGLIGKLDHIRSYTGYSATDHDHAWLHDATVMGGGALRDNGIHLIDLTTYFLGDVAETKGFGTNSVWGFAGCEDNGFALLKNAAGNVATLQASWTEWRGYRLSVEIYGTRGCIRAWCFPMLTHVTWADELGGKSRSKWHLFPKIQVMEKLRSYRWIVLQSFIEEFEAFGKAVQGIDTPLATGQDGLLTIEVAHMAVQAQPPKD
jgi:predicted dehydrogenase